MLSLEPPQAPPSWNHSAEDIITRTKAAIAAERALHDKVGGLAVEDCNFESVSNVTPP